MEARSNVVGTMDYKISPNYAWVVALGAFLTQVLLVFSLSILAINLGEISLDWGIDEGTLGILSSCMGSVSYTHLDVYKRQGLEGVR